MSQAEIRREPMTELDRRAAKALRACVFVPGTWPKRFARDMACIADTTGMITTKQRLALCRQCWRYRRQIADREVLAWAKAGHEHEQGAQTAEDE